MTTARPRLGCHVKVGRTLIAGALKDAEEFGAEAIQIFLGNPRGWRPSVPNPEIDDQFRHEIAQRDLPVYLHAPYLINLGSPSEQTYRRSIELLADNLRRAGEVGAHGVVVHTGSSVDESYASQALEQVKRATLDILESAPDNGVQLLFEPTAGGGYSLCAGVEDLAEYLAAVEHHPRVGICLDTCHVFAAGAPLDEPGGMTATLDLLAEVAGPTALELVHVNDSKDERGSHRDRHEKIGEGFIGLTAFEELIAHPMVAEVPFILETPGASEPDSPCLPLLKKIRG